MNRDPTAPASAAAGREAPARFVLGEPLGDGDSPSSGGGRWGCRLAFSRRSGRAYCGKLIPHLRSSQRERCVAAADELKALRHPNLQRIRAVYATVAPDGTPAVAVISELFLGASLQAWLAARPGPVSDRRSSVWLGQLGSSLAHLHARGLLHYSVHTRNVHVASGERLKLGDFVGVVRPPLPPPPPYPLSGRAAHQLPSSSSSSSSLSVRVTPFVLCPDTGTQVGYTAASDVWALGGVMFEIIFRVRGGLYPPAGRGVCPAVVDLLRWGSDSAAAPPTRPDSDTSPELVGVVGRMVARDPAERPTAAELASWPADRARERHRGAKRGLPLTQTFPLEALGIVAASRTDADNAGVGVGDDDGSRGDKQPNVVAAGERPLFDFACVERLRVFLEDRLGVVEFRAAHSVVSAVQSDTDERAVVETLEQVLPQCALNLYLPALLHLVLRERASYAHREN